MAQLVSPARPVAAAARIGPCVNGLVKNPRTIGDPFGNGEAWNIWGRPCLAHQNKILVGQALTMDLLQAWKRQARIGLVASKPNLIS